MANYNCPADNTLDIVSSSKGDSQTTYYLRGGGEFTCNNDEEPLYCNTINRSWAVGRIFQSYEVKEAKPSSTE